MTAHVADASAVLAMLQGEPGHDRMAAGLGSTVMSAVNLAEVVTGLINNGIPAEDARHRTEAMDIETAPLDKDLALTAGTLREVTAHLGLSLGDRCCLALARQLKLPVLTADRSWTELKIGVEVVLIRE